MGRAGRTFRTLKKNVTTILSVNRLDLTWPENMHHLSIGERQYSIFPDCLPTTPARRYSESPRKSLSSVNMNLYQYPCKRQQGTFPSSRHPSLSLVTEQLLQSRRSSCMSRLGTTPRVSSSCQQIEFNPYNERGTIVEEGSDN